MKCKVTNKELSIDKVYSEKDISDYLASFLTKSFSGDSFSGSPWGNEENKMLYCAINEISEKTYGIFDKINTEKEIVQKGENNEIV